MAVLRGIFVSENYSAKSISINIFTFLFFIVIFINISIAQVTVFSENFNGSASLPTGWSQVQVSGSDVWTINNGGCYDNGVNNPSSAYSGTRNAYLFSPTSPPSTNTRKLVTPVLDLGGLSNITLKFWEARLKWGVDFDELKVYYKTSSTGSWSLLVTYNSAVTAWTQRTISLPNPSSTYYIAFEGIAKYGYGICIDDVAITATITNDASLSGILVENKKTVKATLKNLGTNTLTGVSLNISINGGTTTTTSWTGTLTTGNSTTITFGNKSFSNGLSNIKAWTSNPNSSGDGNKTNDTTSSKYVLIKQFPYQNSFESVDLGNWIQPTTDNMDWTRYSGKTPSSLTGPSASYDGTYYIYTEASGNTPAYRADIHTVDLELSSITNPYLELWYHMYGNQIGELHVDIDSALTWKNDITTALSGNKGNQWNKMLINLNNYRYLNKIRIRAITGSGFLGDLAIDGFKIIDKPEPNIGSDKIACIGDTLSLAVDTGYGYTFIWKKVGQNDTLGKNNSIKVTSSGNYYVIVSAPFGYAGVDTVNVTFYSLPTADFKVNKETQCYNYNSFQFTNNSSVSYDTLTYFWYLGEKKTSTLKNPSISYTFYDSFLVRLVATSTKGCKDSFDKKVYVFPNTYVSFNIDKNSQCLTGNKFNFTNNSYLVKGTSTYKWFFGDNDSSATIHSNHSYKSSDTFTVLLISTTDKGCVDSNSKLVFVRPLPKSDFIIDDSTQCKKGNLFSLINTSSVKYGSLSSMWYFGDKTTSNVTDPKKSYSSSGTYNIKLINTSNFGCKDSISKTVYIYNQPVAKMTINDSTQCLKGNSIIFNDVSTIISGTINSRRWDFGDASSSTMQNTSKSYQNSNTYQVILKVYSDFGCSDSVVNNIFVYPQPNISYTISKTQQCLSSNYFEFTNSSSVSSGLLFSEWSFGDGNKDLSTNSHHTYTKEGIYNVSLLATTDKSCSDSLVKQVEVYPNPKIAFSMNQRSQCVNTNNYVFTNSSKISSGSLTNYWSFGDSESSSDNSPSHKYQQTDTFYVTLKVVSDKNCTDSLTKSIFVRPVPVPAFSIDDTIQCFVANEFKFTNKSTIKYGSLNYLWEFSDTNTSNMDNPVYSFKNYGTFDVKLIAKSNFNCIDSISSPVYVIAPPKINLGKDTVIKDTSILILDAGSGFVSYYWHDGSSSRYFTVDTSLGEGTYKYWVTVTDSFGCTNIDSIQIKIEKSISLSENPIGKISIYPNPTESNINILFDNVLTEEIVISIKDINGREIISDKIQPDYNKTRHSINLNNLSSGVYLMEISGNTIRNSIKIIKK